MKSEGKKDAASPIQNIQIPKKSESKKPPDPVKKKKTVIKDSEVVMKDPSVRSFMETFKAQILSVENKKDTKD